ncbi:MAG: hypothetical protein O7C65_10790 [Planctomycetota bacterium]|nr:hypothetical protein [Planctomycetota bacterium]
MNIVRHSIVVVIALSCGDRAGAVNAAAPHSVAQLQPEATQEDLVSRTKHAEREYRHRLARLRRLRELALQGNDLHRLAALDSLLERLHAARTSRIKQIRARMSGASQRGLDAWLTDGRDLKESVVSGGTDQPRRHPRHEAARKHHAVVPKHHADPSPGLVEPHQIVSHRRAEAHEHAAAQKERAERWRAAKEHAAGDRRAEAHEHAAVQKERAERWRADARQRALRHRRVGTQRGHDKVQKDASEHAGPADVPRQVPKHKRGAAKPGQTLKHKGHPRPEKTGHGKHAPTQARADVAARAAITRANFDAEFEKLRKEIESDG